MTRTRKRRAAPRALSTHRPRHRSETGEEQEFTDNPELPEIALAPGKLS